MGYMRRRPHPLHRSVSSHAIATVQESMAHTRIVWTRRVPCVVPTGFEPATFRPPAGRATDCAAIRRAFLPTGGDGTPLREPCDRRTCPACGENATFMPHPRRVPSRNRTGDAHLRKVALYPLSYRGIRLRVAGTPQHVSRFEGVHIALLLLAVALRIATAFTY